MRLFGSSAPFFPLGSSLRNSYLVKRGQYDANKSVNGFLTYQTEEQCARVIELLQGSYIKGLAKFPVEMDWAWPRQNGRYFAQMMPQEDPAHDRIQIPVEEDVEKLPFQQSQDSALDHAEPDLRQPRTPPYPPTKKPSPPLQPQIAMPMHPRPFGPLPPPMMMPPLHPVMVPPPLMHPLHPYPPPPPYWTLPPPPAPYAPPPWHQPGFQEAAKSAASTKKKAQPPWRSEGAVSEDEDGDPIENDADLQTYFDNMIVERKDEEWEGYCNPEDFTEKVTEKKQKDKEKQKDKGKGKEKQTQKEKGSKDKEKVKKAKRSRSRSKKNEKSDEKKEKKHKLD